MHDIVGGFCYTVESAYFRTHVELPCEEVRATEKGRGELV